MFFSRLLSFTKILADKILLFLRRSNFRYDENDKLIEKYSSMHNLPNGVADSRTKIEITNQFKNGASYCVFVRT